jgi:hypothetical protein
MMQRGAPRRGEFAENEGVTTEAATVLGLLADDDRLRAVAALALGAHTAAQVSETAGLDGRRAGRALARLAGAGLVEPDGDGYRLASERFREALESLHGPLPDPPDSGLGPEADKVLRPFLRDGRLTSIPASRTKRLVLLDALAALFEPGMTYTEAEVNKALVRFHDDVAALRRYLVDEQFLHRRDGFYWRAGGTFHV